MPYFNERLKIKMQNVGTVIWHWIEVIAHAVLNLFFKLIGKELTQSQFDAFMQFVKFGIVGVSNTVISYVLYAVSLIGFQKAGVLPKSDYLVAQVIAFVLSVLWSFYWNNKLVFVLEEGKQRSVWKALLKTYVSYSFTGLFLNSILLILWVQVVGISEFIAKKYSEKETPSLFKGIDNIGLITELCKNLENIEMGIIEMVKFEKEHLEMVVYTNKQVGNDYYIIVDYKTYKDTTKPYFTARKIKTGKEVHSRIKQSKIFKENPFGLYSVLKIKEFMPEFKKKFTDGKWSVTDETEDVLTEYEVIKS